MRRGSKPADRRRWRQAWVLTAQVPTGRSEQFPTIQDGAVLAILPRRTRPDAVEAAMITLFHTLVLDDASDRLAFVVDEAPWTPAWNLVHRHAELAYPGLPSIAATMARVRLTAADEFAWEPQPWPPGVTAEDVARRARELRGDPLA
ncbi:hypothetical protein [Cellulomonas hominis]